MTPLILLQIAIGILCFITPIVFILFIRYEGKKVKPNSVTP
jgi:hypothetical protein